MSSRCDGLTVRQRLEAHRKNASCVNCHARIDPLGFALEPFDPLGRWRDAYGDGQPIDPSGTLRDGTTVSGPDGLRDYLRREEAQFHRTVSVKLLGYALGRAEMVSDRPLIEQMTDDLARGGPLRGPGRADRHQRAVPEPTIGVSRGPRPGACGGRP